MIDDTSNKNKVLKIIHNKKYILKNCLLIHNKITITLKRISKIDTTRK